MLEESKDNLSVELQALAALQHLSDDERRKVLEYLKSLIILENTKNDKGSLT